MNARVDYSKLVAHAQRRTNPLGPDPRPPRAYGPAHRFISEREIEFELAREQQRKQQHATGNAARAKFAEEKEARRRAKYDNRN